MATTIEPIFYKTIETKNYLDNLSVDIKKSIGKDSDLLLDRPGIYIHVWRSKYDILNGTYSIYIGETNNIIGRTKEHWDLAYAQMKIPKSARNKGQWQWHMLDDEDDQGNKVIPTVYFFGHKLFHKSLTLDIENRLIDFCMAMPTAKLYNGRTNPQGLYSGEEDLDSIFSMIWRKLRSDNKELFMSESEIKKSAIYKASPNHRLTDEQKEARQLIIDRTVDAILSDKNGQLVFVEGEAGTGKTVLTCSTFYDLLDNDALKDLKIKACMLINHDEQRMVYENIARKLGYSEDIIQHPTTFLIHNSVLDNETNTFEPIDDEMMDVVFIDEAHLLWNQRNQKYDTRFKYPQLDEIMRRARVTVIMYDENQVLHKGQVSSYKYMVQKRKLAQSQGADPANGKCNYILMNNQLRMNCSVETMNWVDSITKSLTVNKLVLDSKMHDSNGYEVRIFNDPAELHKAIIDKASKEDTKLSRVVADFEWEYKNGGRNQDVYGDVPWKVTVGNWSIPWNEEIFWLEKYPILNSRERKIYKLLDWAEKDTSLGEAGSTFTIQGFDLAYVGIILGPAVKYDKDAHKIWFDAKKCFRPNYMTGVRKFDDGEEIDVTDLIFQHEIRVLFTRGTKGIYVYAADPDLREALSNSLVL